MDDSTIRAFIREQIRRLQEFEASIPTPAPPAEPVPGVDVYHGDGDIDWTKVAAEGIRFAIVKATEGVDFVDRKLSQNAQGVRAAGLLLNYYHFGRPDTGQDHRSDARAEAGDFLQAISAHTDPDILQFPNSANAAVWLDLEKTASNLDETQGLEWIDDWLAVVETRWPVGLYTSKRWLEREATPTDTSWSQLVYRSDGSKRPIWVARYGPNDGQPHPDYDPDDKVPSAWGTWDIWQYSSKGRVEGIPSNCDVNLARLGG